MVESTSMKVDGRCHCGRITFEAEVDPAKVLICHCTDCQVLSGGAFRTVVRVPTDAFRLLSGEPKKYVKQAESGNRMIQAFCSECGSPIYGSHVDHPAYYGLRVATLRQRYALPPKLQIWCRSAHSWASSLDHLPKIERHG
jgi:hypothetical protein